MGDPVLDTGVVVDVLVTARQVDTVQLTVGALPAVVHHHVDALEHAAEPKVKAVERGVRPQPGMHPADVQGGGLFQLQAVVTERGACLQQELGDPVGEALLFAACAGKMLDQADLSWTRRTASAGAG